MKKILLNFVKVLKNTNVKWWTNKFPALRATVSDIAELLLFRCLNSGIVCCYTFCVWGEIITSSVVTPLSVLMRNIPGKKKRLHLENLNNIASLEYIRKFCKSGFCIEVKAALCNHRLTLSGV